jgi:hypothetical protein
MTAISIACINGVSTGMTTGWQLTWQVARRRAALLAKLVAKYRDLGHYTQSVGSTDPQTQAVPADEPGWSDCPPGCISVSEASHRTGFSSEWLRQLAHAGGVDSILTRVGNRTRIWLAEDQVSELARAGNRKEFKGRPSSGRPSGTAQSGSGGERDPVADERDRWRSEALRMREAGLLMAAAFDAQREADQHRTDSREHMQAAAISMDKAFEKAREAMDYKNQALRQFMIPTDMLEN